MTPAERVVEALTAAGCNPKGGPTTWTARCPVQAGHTNGDKHPSLSVAESPTGLALITCHKGCITPDVTAALNLTMRDLFPEDTTPKTAPTGIAVTKARYPYHDEDGELLYEVVKIIQDDGRKTYRARAPQNDGTWSWSVKDVRRVIYHLPQVVAAVREGRPVVICEGEKDAETAAWMWADVRAATTCNPFGAGADKWKPEYNEPFRGANVTIVADDDTVGRLHADIIRTHLTPVAASVTVLLPAEPHNDLTDHANAGLDRTALRPMVDDTVDIVEWEDVALPGGQALALYGDTVAARWGDGDRILWAHGESMLVAGRTGVGKTTFALSVVAGLTGLEPDFLGFPIQQAEVTLYLAMDRPRQIIRAMRRRFGPDVYDLLDERLIVRRGPLPADLAKDPSILLRLAERYSAEVVVIDSLKDAAVKLSDDEVGGQVNRAVQHLNAADIDSMILHHNRKGDVTQRQGDDYEPSVEDVYGSNWITSGAGSVLMLHGTPGAELVKMWHVKQPADPIGPYMLEHDHVAGRTKIVHSFDILAWLRHRGPGGGTAIEAAKAEHQKDTIKSDGKEAARSKRLLNSLVKAGKAERMDGAGRDSNGQQRPERWRYVDRDELVGSRDAGRDGGVADRAVTEPCRTVTKNEKPQVVAVTPAVTHRDEPSAVTNAGGITTPASRQGPQIDPADDLFANLDPPEET